MKISVIIPVYNLGELLRNSVESVISQIKDGCEIILIDDGSTDNSGSICDEYAYVENLVIIHKANGGLSSARNTGIEAAKGEYLLFLDGDDYLLQDSIRFLRQFISDKGQFDFLQFKYDEVSDFLSNKVATEISYFEELTHRRQMYERKYRLGGIGASACTKLISRESLGTLRFKEGIIHEDELFTTQLINKSNRVLYITNVFYMYVQRPNSIITSRFSIKKLDIVAVLNEEISILTLNGYEDLASMVRNQLFTCLCTIYVEARRSNICQAIPIIKENIQSLLPQVTIKSGSMAKIVKGLKYHLPVLQMYYWYKKLING